MRKWFFIAFGIFTLASCTKSAGEGGSATIQGVVNVEVRSSIFIPQTKQYTAPAADQNVYIIYGDAKSPGESVDTNYDGEFEFKNLRMGDYTVYVYSRDTTAEANSGTAPRNMAVIQEITIVDRKQEITTDPFLIYDNL